MAAVVLCAATAQAQTKFGAQFNFSTSELSTIGAGAHAEIFFSDIMSIQPAFDYYFSKDVVGGKSSTWMINADFHYYFSEEPKIYGIGGLSYVNNVQDINVLGGLVSGSVTQTGVGLNLGAGANFGMFFAEAKYSTKLSGLVLTAGVKFGGN